VDCGSRCRCLLLPRGRVPSTNTSDDLREFASWVPLPRTHQLTPWSLLLRFAKT
jgi:hypothetical protein